MQNQNIQLTQYPKKSDMTVTSLPLLKIYEEIQHSPLYY